jgi:PAS domain S-box-containing protein
VWVNRAAADLAGLAPEQLAGRKCYEIWHRRAAPCEDCPVLRAKETGLPQHGEITTPDGRIWAVRGYPIHNEAGQVSALIEFGQDITARKHSEEALRESEERFRMAAQVTGEVICDCDFATGRTTWTGAIREVTGYSSAEFQRFDVDSCHELIHPEDREAVKAAIGRSAQTGGEFTLEFRLRRKDGAYVPVELRGVFLPPASGPLRMLGSLKDVSERKRAEERLVQAQKMESVGRLAGGIAHDFNNLLTVINGYSSLLLSRMHDLDPARPGVAEIEKAGQRAADLVRQLLAFSRKQVLKPRVLNVNDVAAQMEAMLRRLSGEDIEIALDLEPSLVPVRADPGQLHQVLLNLAANARDAMPSGGRLNIRTRNVVLNAPLRDGRNPEVPPGRYCTFSVTDSGFGISEEVRGHLFEPFYTTKEVGKGTGLGLSTVHGIVTQSGGYITVASEVKKGTAFTVYLPAADDTAGEPSAPAAAETRNGTETILVVEDQREVADFVVATLESCGYRVFRVANAGEALELCRNTNAPLHLLLTDVVMPGMNGRELAARVVQLRPGIRVVYMSGYDEEALARRLGPDPDIPLLFKPFTPATLAEAVAKQLRAVR